MQLYYKFDSDKYGIHLLKNSRNIKVLRVRA